MKEFAASRIMVPPGRMHPDVSLVRSVSRSHVGWANRGPIVPLRMTLGLKLSNG